MPPVVLVSLDGIAPRYVTPEGMPRLTGLARSGAACFVARTIDPPWTRPVHASMLRGVDAARHGLIDNSMAPLAGGTAPSVFAVAAAAGRSTASITNWRQMDSLIESDAVHHRVFIDAGYDPAEDGLMIDHLTAIWNAGPPDVTFAYLCRADLAGHEHGWGSDEYREALTAVDAAFGRLLDVVGTGTSVVATTDHGGVGTNHATTDRDVMEIFVAARSTRIAAGSVWTEASTLDIAPTLADLASIAPDPRWQGSTLAGRERPMVDHLLDLLQATADHHYGESVTMLDHALQSAAEIAAAGGDDDLTLAALLHDIGHLLGEAGGYGDPGHAEVGARFLRPWLPQTVTEPIRLHVDAKRHLVGSDPAYASTLSAASKVTLDQQGGPLGPAGSAAFLAETHADRAMALRRCDDLGKRPDVDAEPLESWRGRLAHALATAPVDPAWARAACDSSRDATSGQRVLTVDDAVGWTVLGTRRRPDRFEVDLARGDERHTAVITERAASPDLAAPRSWPGQYVPTARAPSDVGSISGDVIRDGVALVGGMPTDDGEVLRFAETLGFVRETNYGRLFDVRVEPEAINLAYTALGLPLHTDNPYRDPVPTVQVLLCLQPAASGGATDCPMGSPPPTNCAGPTRLPSDCSPRGGCRSGSQAATSTCGRRDRSSNSMRTARSSRSP